MLNLAKRAWVPLVVVVAVALGATTVDRLRDVFGSEKIFSATASTAAPLTPSYVKRVTYEVYGPSDTTGTVSYLTMNAQPEQVNFTSLPWSYTVTTTLSAVVANLVAQGDSDNLGCRITVNGEIKDQQSSTGHHAQAFCLVKAG